MQNESHFPPATWRLICTDPAKGAFNMALDQAIMEAVQRGDSPPTVRFYAWEPACLSLGFAQKSSAANLIACEQFGWDIVRRTTGGRAILHTDELTYSVAIPIEDPRVEGGIHPSYRRLSSALLMGLESMQLAIDEPIKKEGTISSGGPVCFDTPSHYEITFNGKKLVGSAQTRKRGVVLQHGTIPLRGDIGRIVTALAFESDEIRQKTVQDVRNSATTLTASLGRAVTYQETAVALQHGFSTALNLSFTSSDPTDSELERTHELINEKFDHNENWTLRI